MATIGVLPVVRAQKAPMGQISVVCPYCSKTHYHNVSVGGQQGMQMQRAADCFLGDYLIELGGSGMAAGDVVHSAAGDLAQVLAEMSWLHGLLTVPPRTVNGVEVVMLTVEGVEIIKVRLGLCADLLHGVLSKASLDITTIEEWGGA